MAVFINWSGKNSRSPKLANVLRGWIPKVIQKTECFLSSEDIGAGQKWMTNFFIELNKSDVGMGASPTRICASKIRPSPISSFLPQTAEHIYH